MAIRFVSSSLIPSSSFYARESGSESGSLVSTAYITVVGKYLGEIKGDFNDDRLRITLASQSFGGSGDVNVLTMSASGDAPRVGIGITNPKRAFDFKEVRDDNRGGEMLIRSSRTTKGAEVGDEAGRLNFVIDSASYNDIETSGSVAQIVAKVTDETPDGVFGGLSLQVADSAKNGSTERIFIDPGTTRITGSVDVGSFIRSTAQNSALGSLRVGSYGSSIDSGDLSVQSEIEVFGNTENALRLVNGGITLASTTGKGNITASGNISASGDLTANNGFFSGNLEVTGAIDVKNGHINLDTNSYFLQGTSTGGGNVSLIGVDGTDFVSIGNQGFTNIIYDSLITGSVDITGSLTVDGTITGNSIIGTIGTATQGTIDHDSLANFVANEHINHTSVSISSGDGLSGGGTIASTRILTLDTSSAHFTTGVSESAAAAGFGGGGGGSGTVTEVTVGTGLDVTNGTTTPNVTLDLTEITLSNGLDSTATGLTLDLSEVGFTGTANGIITSDNDGTVTTESTLTYNGTILTLDGTMRFTPGTANNGISTRIDNQWESTTLENNGEYVEVGTAISRTQHFLYNLGSSGWVAADADAVSTSAGFLGVAIDGTTASTFLIRGVFNILSTNITDPGVGKAVYVSTTAGAYTCTAPVAAGDVVRIVGHVVDSFVSGRSTYYKIYFNPSQDWIEL